MKATVYVIGVFVITAILYVIPILTACSFIYKWNGFLKMVLIMASIIEGLELVNLIMDKISKEE